MNSITYVDNAPVDLIECFERDGDEDYEQEGAPCRGVLQRLVTDPRMFAVWRVIIARHRFPNMRPGELFYSTVCGALNIAAAEPIITPGERERALRAIASAAEELKTSLHRAEEWFEQGAFDVFDFYENDALDALQDRKLTPSEKTFLDGLMFVSGTTVCETLRRRAQSNLENWPEWRGGFVKATDPDRARVRVVVQNLAMEFRRWYGNELRGTIATVVNVALSTDLGAEDIKSILHDRTRKARQKTSG